MADVFKLAGSYATLLAGGEASGVPVEGAQLSESVTLKRKSVQTHDLVADAPVVVSLGGLSQFEVLVLRAVGGKVRVRLTSADGASQSVPVDGLLVLISLAVPFTAMDLTRLAGTATTVVVFMGERA